MKTQNVLWMSKVSGLLTFLLCASISWAGVGTSDLEITKTDGATVSVIGGSVTYTIVGSNDGPDDVFGGTVTDTFSSDLTCTWTCSASAGSSCTASGSGDISDSVNLLETGTVTYTVNCTISGSASPGTLVNTASITSAAIDPDVTNNSATDTNSLFPSADLSITKTDGVTTAAPGAGLTYTIVASNAGPMASFNTTVADTFPTGLTCTWTCSASVGSSCSAAGSGNISDPVSLLSGGSATYTATCTIDLTATGTLSNTATISGSVSDPNTGNESATDNDTVLTPSTDLSITKADSVDPVTAGESLTYTLTVTNTGPSNSTGATVTDVLPAGMTFNSSSDCTEAGGTVTCAINALNVTGSEMVSFTVDVDPGRTTALSNTATVAANETDPTAGNNSATEGTAVDTETDLSLTKADSVDPVNAGDSLIYTLNVTNNGPSASTGATVTDALPAGTTFNSSSDCTEAGGTVTCAIGALGVGGNEMVSFTVDVDPDRTTALSNTASVTANETDSTSGNDSDTEATAVGTETDLSLAKADSVDPVNAGDSLTYTLTVTNNGPSDSTGATVTDTLPAGTTFNSSSDCTEAAGTVTCAIGALGVGGSDMVSFTVDVDPDRTTALSNTATVAANETDSTSGNDSDTEATAVATETDLSIAKADSVDPVNAGDSLLYTLTVTNNGPSESTGATVTDVLPAGTTFNSSSDCTEAAGTVTCAIGALGVGGSDMVSFTVDVDPDRTTALSNTATVAANETDSTSGNDSATEGTAIAAETDFSIAKADSADPVNAGDSLTYTLTVTNNGPSASTGATVTDVLPAGTTFNSSSDCTEAGGTVTCAIGALSVSGSDMVSFTVDVDPGQTTALSNTATVAANETDSNAANDSATEGTAVGVETDLSLAKSDSPDPVEAGADLTYTLTVTNNGPSSSTGATVTDTVPTGTTFDSSSDCSEAGGTVTCSLGALAPMGSEAVSFVVTVDPGQTSALSNTATVAANETDSNAANDSATATTSILVETDLSITQDDSPDPVVAGEDLTYTLTVTNDGPGASTGATVTDVLPAGVTFSSSSDCTEAGGTVTCAIGALGVSASEMVSFVVTVDPGQTSALSNTATVAANETDSNATNDSATSTTTVISDADLGIAKTDSSDPVAPNAAFTYTVTVTNAGPSDAVGVTVLDTLPAGVTLLNTAGCTEDPNGVPTCTLGTIPAGGMASYSISVSAPPSDGVVTNTATVSATTSDSNTTNNTATEDTTVTSTLLSADLSITKDDGVTTAVPGGTVIYTIVASNAGPDDVTGATVMDLFPASLTCSWTCASAAGATCSAAGTGDINDTVDLPNGGSVTYTATCSIDPAASGDLVNTATVLSPIGDPNPGDESATDMDTLETSADLSILSTTTPNPAVLGELVSIEVGVLNDGPSDATNTVVDIVLPSGLSFVGTVGCVEDPNGVTICSLGTIPAGQMAFFTIEATASAEGTSTGSLAVSSDVADPDGANDADIPEVTVLATVDIPTLGTWGFLALVMLLAFSGLGTLRRRSS